MWEFEAEDFHFWIKQFDMIQKAKIKAARKR